MSLLIEIWFVGDILQLFQFKPVLTAAEIQAKKTSLVLVHGFD